MYINPFAWWPITDPVTGDTFWLERVRVRREGKIRLIPLPPQITPVGSDKWPERVELVVTQVWRARA